MLTGLYPQRWQLCRYLGVFLGNLWDLLSSLHKAPTGQVKILVLRTGNDELVPRNHAEGIAAVSRRKEGVLGVDIKTVEGALHTECIAKPLGRSIVVQYFGEVMGEND
jgi:hypothetical protein